MALALESKHDGLIRFCREPKRNGGGLLAVFPKGDYPGVRDCYDGACYDEAEVGYVRSLRTADPVHDRAMAERMIRRIDARAEYVRSLMTPID